MASTVSPLVGDRPYVVTVLIFEKPEDIEPGIIEPRVTLRNKHPPRGCATRGAHESKVGCASILGTSPW